MMILKHALRAALVLGTPAALASGAEASTTSANLGVDATVASTCTLATSAVAFGTVNTISGSNVDANGGITVTCTSGTAWTAGAGVGSGTGASLATRKLTSGANHLNYSLYTDSGYTSVWGDGSAGSSTLAGTGTGTGQSVSVYGRIAAGQTSAPAGSYSDTVAVTVTY